MESRMRTVIIGTGRMGRLHVRAVQELGLELAGVSDRRMDSLEQAARDGGLLRASLFSDAAQMLRQIRPDLVVIATTAPSHWEYTCLAAESGARFILCEKPMAVSLAQCDRMLDRCDRCRARLAINHPMRFMPLYSVPRELLRSEMLGGLASMTVIGGNCGMAMNATHKLEGFRFISGETVREVTAWFSPDPVPNPRGAEFLDMAGALRATTDGGKRLYVDISADQGHGVVSIYAGRHGHLTVDEMTGTLTMNTRQEACRAKPTNQYWNPHEAMTRPLAPSEALGPAKAVLQALMTGEAYPTGEQARQAIAALVAAYVSHEQGGLPVCVDERLPKERTFPWA
jgi:predicted dehydrogenase